jgi:hypothetical protein
MKNLRARRFSNIPISGDLTASMSVAGTLWIYNQGITHQQTKLRKMQILSNEHANSNIIRKRFYLSFIVDEAAINSFEIQIFRDICMNEDTNKSAICHHKLAKRDLVKIQEEIETAENYSHGWWTERL